MKKPIDKESVLYAFAVESTHDRSTIERYLRNYPELAEELIDLSAELRFGEGLTDSRNVTVSDPGLKAARDEFLATTPQKAPIAAVANPFAQFRGPAFVALAQSLDVPRSFLTALRDGLIVASSVPKSFVHRFAAATGTAVNSLTAHLSEARSVPTGLAFKSKEKPSPQGQTTFRQLVKSTEMTEAQRIVLFRECDDDELD